jgi:hypothetical protein
MKQPTIFTKNVDKYGVDEFANSKVMQYLNPAPKAPPIKIAISSIKFIIPYFP